MYYLDWLKDIWKNLTEKSSLFTKSNCDHFLFLSEKIFDFFHEGSVDWVIRVCLKKSWQHTLGIKFFFVVLDVEIVEFLQIRFFRWTFRIFLIILFFEEFKEFKGLTLGFLFHFSSLILQFNSFFELIDLLSVVLSCVPSHLFVIFENLLTVLTLIEFLILYLSICRRFYLLFDCTWSLTDLKDVRCIISGNFLLSCYLLDLFVISLTVWNSLKVIVR